MGRKKDEMSRKPCKCRGEMHEVLSCMDKAGKPAKIITRTGWWCPNCNAWEEAILRERLVE